MPTSLLVLADDVLLLILRRALPAKEPNSGRFSTTPCVGSALLVCKRFRDVLIAAATSVCVACDDPALLRLCRRLRSMTLTGRRRAPVSLPWAAHTRDRVPCCGPEHLSHLSTLTSIDVSSVTLPDAEMSKLRCLPALQRLCVSTSVTDAGVAHLAGMTSLRCLDLRGCTRLTPACLPHLASLSALESLDTVGSGLSVCRCVAHLTNLRTLSSFRFKSPGRQLFAPRRTLHLDLSAFDLCNLARLTALRSLDLLGAIFGGTHAGVCHLSALRSLEALDLSCNRSLSHDCIAFVSCLTALQTLKLVQCSGVDFNKGLRHVAQLTRLTQLAFYSARLGDAGVAHLVHLTGLTELDIEGCTEISETGFRCLRSLVSLQRLCATGLTREQLRTMVPHLMDLRGLDVSLDDLDNGSLAIVCQLSRLTFLELRPGVTAAGLAHISSLRELKHLYVGEDCKLRVPLDSVIAHVSGLTKLEVLQLENAQRLSAAGVACLSNLRNLEYLPLEGYRWLTDRELGALTRLSSLFSLSLSHCSQITDLTLAACSAACLRHLDLTGYCAVTDDSLATLSGLDALLSLHLCRCSQLTDAGLTRLRGLTALTRLDLSSCTRVTGWGLQHLTRLQALERLDLCECVLLDGRAMPALGCLRALTSLSLSGCVRVPNEGLSHLASLLQLQNLSVCSIPVTSAGLAHVARAWTLTSLNLVGSPHLRGDAMACLTSLVQLWVLSVGSDLAPVARTLLRGLKNVSIH